MAEAFWPSALLMALCFSPSDWSMAALFSRSAFTWPSMAFMMELGGVRSRIS